MNIQKRSVWTAIRALIAAGVMLFGLRPPAGLVLLGPQQHVESINPKMGVHTRLTDEVEEWKIKHSLELVREMGAGWIVEYFPWEYSEPEKGTYAWDHADMVIAHARQQGLRVIARIGMVPQWARPEGTQNSFLLPARYGDLADFCHAFVNRYKDTISHVIVWNEPNLGREWGYRDPDPAEYAQMLRTVYPRCKEAAPDVRVLGGALAPTMGAPDAVNDLDYLRGMYDAGAAPYFDVLAVHAYGWSFPPDQPPAPDVISFSRTELWREIALEYGDDKPIMITEGGWNDHSRWTMSVSHGQRIIYTLQAYEMAKNEWPWCEVVAMWVFRYPEPKRGYLDNFTFVTVDFVRKPVYLEVQNYARGNDVSKWLE